MGRRGIEIQPPIVVADLLERRFGVLPRRARELAIEILAPAVAASDPSAVERALQEIARQLQGVLDDRDVEQAAEDAAARVSDYHRKAWFAGLGVAIGMKILTEADRGGGPPKIPTGMIPTFAGGGRGMLIAKLSAEPRLLADDFAAKNVQLIKSLRDELVPALRDEVVRVVQFGYTPEEAAERLAAKWKKQGVPLARGDAEPRIRMIVRDQVTKLNTDLGRARAQAAGITKFTWTSQRDDRVRPLHEELDGEEFGYGDGHPEEGLPGQPPGCRCVAVPVVDRDQVIASAGFVHLAESEFEIAS